MSTTPIDTWAVDLADVTVIYPFHGAETIMVLIGVALWILWHIWQIPFESREFEEEIKNYGDKETILEAIDNSKSPPA